MDRKTRTTVLITTTLHKEIRKILIDNNLSFSALVEELLEKYKKSIDKNT